MNIAELMSRIGFDAREEGSVRLPAKQQPAPVPSAPSPHLPPPKPHMGEALARTNLAGKSFWRQT